MKRRITALLIIAVQLITIFTSCKSEESEKTENEQPLKIEKKMSNVFKCEYIEIPSEYQISSYVSTPASEIFSYLSYETLNPDTYESRPVYISFDETGKYTINAEMFSDVNLEEQRISYYAATSDGGYFLVIRGRNASDPIYLTKYSSSREVEFSRKMSELMSTDTTYEEDGLPNGFSVSGIFERDGKFYISSNDTVAVISSSGEKLAAISLSPITSVTNIFVNHDGNIIVSGRSSSTSIGQIIYYIDEENKKLGEQFIIPDTFGMGMTSYYSGPEYELYIKTDVGLYGANSGEEPILLSNWVNSNISPTTIKTINVISNEKVICICQNPVTRQYEIVVMTALAEDEIPKKEIITLAHSGIDYSLESYAVEFNRKSDNYQIVLTDYSQYNTPDDYSRGSSILSNEIISGNIPDIIQCTQENSPKGKQFTGNNYVQKGLFTDLYPFFDDELPLSNYLECLQKPLEYNGKLYLVPTRYSFSVLIAKSENFPGITDGNWTYEDVIEKYYSLNEDQKLYSESVMDLLDINRFIDYENNTTDFTNDTYIQALKMRKDEYKNHNIFYDYRLERVAAVRSNKLIIMKMGIGVFPDITDGAYFAGTNEITMLNMPDSDYTSTLNIMVAYGISEKSDVKEGAWEFIKCLTDSTLREYSSSEKNLPVTVDQFEAHIQKYLDYTYVFEKSTAGRTMKKNGTFDEETEALNAELWPITEHHLEIMRKVMQNCFYSYNDTEMIDSIIREEWSEYLYGDSTTKTAEEVAKAIQGRASIYVSETYG